MWRDEIWWLLSPADSPQSPVLHLCFSWARAHMAISAEKAVLTCPYIPCSHDSAWWEWSTIRSEQFCSVLTMSQILWLKKWSCFSSVQFSSVAHSYLTLCSPMNCSTPGLPVHHQLPEFTQTRVRRVGDVIQPSHPLSSPSPPAPNPSQHQSLFQWVNSLHEVAKVLEFQL